MTGALGRMGALIDGLLEYSRVDARGEPFSAVPLNEVLDDALRNLSAALAASGGQVQCGPLPSVHGDRVLLLHLLQNLQANALKFRSVDPPRIRIWASATSDGWRVSVQDNGPGIAAEHHARVFGAFQRLHAPDSFPGAGLGLAVCRRIVERHGGELWVESVPGEGATFHFTLLGTSEGS